MKINYGKQHIEQSDISKVISALKSDKITQGKFVSKFEQNLKKKFKSKYCLSVSNGTAALYLSIKSLNLSKNSKIVCSTNTFFSSVYTVIMNDLIPDLCDIELKTYNIDLNKLEDKIKKDKNIKAVISVDFAGHPCDWKSLNFLKKKYNISLINDNCHAVGARIHGDLGYACKYADLVTHSYHPVKNITSAEGGMICTNNEELAKRIRSLRSHGIVRGGSIPWYPKQAEIGYNYRMTEPQAALGRSQSTESCQHYMSCCIITCMGVCYNAAFRCKAIYGIGKAG